MGGGGSKNESERTPVVKDAKINDDILSLLITTNDERRRLIAEIAGLERISYLQAEVSSNNKFKSHAEMVQWKNNLNNDRISFMNYIWERDADCIMRVSTHIDESNLPLAHLLATRTRWQLRQISDCMKRKYSMILSDALQIIYLDSNLSEMFTKVLISYRMSDPIERDVHLLQTYTIGKSFHIKDIIVLIMTRSNDELRQVLTSFLAKTGKSLADVFRTKCKDVNFRDFILKVLECERDESDKAFDEETAKAKALQLYDAAAGKTFGQPDADAFIRVLTNVNVPQFQSISDQYENKQLQQDIIKYFPGPFSEALLTRAREKFQIMADYLHDFLQKDLPSSSSSLGIFASLSHGQCARLRATYDSLGGPSLISTIRRVLTGPILSAFETLIEADVRLNPLGSYRDSGRDDKRCEAVFREAATAAKQTYSEQAVVSVGAMELDRQNAVDDVVVPSTMEQYNRMTAAEKLRINRESSRILQRVKAQLERAKVEKKAAKRSYIETCGKLAEDIVWIDILESDISALTEYVVMCDCMDIYREFSNSQCIDIDRASRTLIRIICRRDRKHIGKIIENFPNYSGKTLMSVIRNYELEENLKSFLVALQITATNKSERGTPGAVDLDVFRLEGNLKKFLVGDKAAALDCLLEIICTRDNGDMSDIKALFQQKYQQQLESAFEPVVEAHPALFSLVARALRANRDEGYQSDSEAAQATVDLLIARRTEILTRFADEISVLQRLHYESENQRVQQIAAIKASRQSSVTASLPPENSEICGGNEFDVAATETRCATSTEEAFICSESSGNGNHGTDAASVSEAVDTPPTDPEVPTNENLSSGAGRHTDEAVTTTSAADEFDVLVRADGVGDAYDNVPPVVSFVPPQEYLHRQRAELFELYLSVLGDLNLRQLTLVQDTFDHVVAEQPTSSSSLDLVRTIERDLVGSDEGALMMDVLFAWLGDRVLYFARVLYVSFRSDRLTPSLAIRIFSRISLLDCRRVIHTYSTIFHRDLSADIQVALETYPFLLEAMLSFAFGENCSSLVDPRLKAVISDKKFVGYPRPRPPISDDDVDLTVFGVNSLSVYLRPLSEIAIETVEATHLDAEIAVDGKDVMPLKRFSFMKGTFVNRVHPI